MDLNTFACPLCCGQKFSCRASLLDHLVQVSHDLRCPVCHQSQPTIAHLVTHLEIERCHSPVQTHLESLQSDNADETANSAAISESEHDYEVLIKNASVQNEPQTQQLQFVSSGDQLNVIEGTDNHILIVGDDTAGLLGNRNIITTQNEDGTISFRQVGSEELSEVGAEVLEEAGEEVDEDGEEMYSCNTCGVSFTSVVQHIHNYHSQQHVVVEVADESECAGDMRPLTNKRVITEKGDIVDETDYAQLSLHKDSDGNFRISSSAEEEVTDKSGLTYTRRLVRIDKFWNDSESNLGNKVAEAGTVQFGDSGEMRKLYSCSNCHLRSISFELIQNHECKPPGVYNCMHCPATYANSKSLCAHMKVHKINSKSKSPNAADSVLAEKKELMAVGPAQMSFKCDVCETVFPSNKSLRLHRRMHDPIKARPMEGPVSYEAEAGSENEDTFHCEVCDKWIHVGYRTIHEEYHHSSTQFHCEICNRKFLSQDYLTMHMNIHNTEKTNTIKPEKSLPYSCLYCNRQFARPHEKVKHERIHTGEKPHTCEICGKAFRVSYCLTLHMRTHTGARPYECPHCGKRFKAHSVYNHHLLTHSDVRAYKCPYCPKAFKTSVQLAGHKNSHTKPFSCTQCNRPFASLYAVRVHTETHRRQNNLKFSCKLCGASYARAFALKDHMKSAHNDGDLKESTEFTLGKKTLELDPALALLPKKEDTIEVQHIVNSGAETVIMII